MALRLLYLILVRLVDWLVLLTRASATKDVQLRHKAAAERAVENPLTALGADIDDPVLAQTPVCQDQRGTAAARGAGAAAPSAK